MRQDDKLSLAGSAYEHRQATIHELSDTQGSGWQDSYSYAYDDAEMNGAADEEMVYYDHHSDMYRARSAGGGARPSWADASGKSPDAHGDRQRSVRATTRVWTNDRTVESNGSADPNLAPRGRGASALEAAEPWGDRLQQKQSVDLKAFEPISFQTTVAGPSMKLPSCSGSSAAGTEVRRYEQRDESASDIRDSQSAWRPESAHGAGNDWAVGGRSGARGSHEQEQASVSQAGLEHRRQASVGYQRLNLNVTRNPEYARSSADPGQQPTETSFAPPGRSAATLSVSLATPVAMAPATVPMDIYSRPFHSGSSASVNGQQHPPPKEGVAFTGGADLVTHKVQHADGKLEQMFASGKRSVLFANGTYKEQLPDGTTIICFKNQDIKRSAPSGVKPY